MLIKLYPKGYDPDMSELPTTRMIREGRIWDLFQAQKNKKLEARAKLVRVTEPPLDMWYELIKED